MNLNQDQLMLFKTVMECGSFSAAARQLGKVPSAVSMAIANLEIDLNLTLFDRVGREPIPTLAAQHLYQKALHLLVDLQAWQQYAQALSQGGEAELTIAVVSELQYSNWPHYVAQVAHAFPSVKINILNSPQEDAVQLLDSGRAQLAFMFEREQLQSGEQFVEVEPQTLVPVAAISHALAQQQAIGLSSLQQHRQIVVASRDRERLPELSYSKDVWHTDHHDSACRLILQGLGWGILPLQMLHEHPHLAAQLKILPLCDFSPQLTYFMDMVWRSDRFLGQAAQFLIHHIQNCRKNLL